MMSLTFANKITICRILIVPFFISVLLYYSPQRDCLRLTALGLFMVAVITDLIDGYIARRWHQKTRAGSVLDPLADKLLLISAYVCLYRTGVLYPDMPVRLPMWLVVAVISRDVILLIGSMLIFLFQGDLTVEPSLWGKLSTFFQILAVIGVLVQQSVPGLWMVVVFFTVVSGLDYLRNGVKVLNAPPKNNM